MAYPFDPTQHPLNSKPSSDTALMSDWRFWVNGLTYFERSQLYPGLQPETIVSVEMNRAQQNGFGSGLGNDLSSGLNSGYNAPPASSLYGSANNTPASPSTNTQSLPSFGASSTSGPGTLTPMGSPAQPAPFAPFGTSPAPTSLAPASPPYASPSYKPYTPYVPYAPPAPWQPPLAQVAPMTTAVPPSMLPGSGSGTPGSAPYRASYDTGYAAGYGAPVAPPVTHSVAPAPLPQFPLAATKPALPPLPPGVTWRPMGLLDFSYVRRPETGNTSKTGTTARNAQYGRASNAWDRFTEFVEGAWEATEEGRRFATELASDFIEAPREEQIEFLVGLGDLLAEFNVAYGTAKDIKRLVDRPELRTPAAIFGIIIGILPLFRSVRVGRKITAFIKHNAAKLKSAKAARKQGGKRPADIPENKAPTNQVKASGEGRDSGDYASGGKAPHFTGTPDWWDAVKGAAEASAAEAIAQLFPNEGDFKALLRGEDVELGTIDLITVAAAAPGGAGAGISAGFESEDGANLVMQFLVDFPAIAINTWLMRIARDRRFSEDAANVALVSTFAPNLLNVLKIGLFHVASNYTNMHLRKWQPKFRQAINRWIKIAINRYVDEVGEKILSAAGVS